MHPCGCGELWQPACVVASILDAICPQAGQLKAARRAYDAVLSTAAAAMAQRPDSGDSANASPLGTAAEIVVAYAEAELKCGGREGVPLTSVIKDV